MSKNLNYERLRPVIDFEVDYILRSYEEELSLKKKTLKEIDKKLKERDKKLEERQKEIEYIKSILKENNIPY